jgi:hypothetical protein
MKAGERPLTKEKVMKTLVHDQQIKTRQDQYSPVITIGTIEGYAKERGADVQKALEQNEKNAKANPWTKYDLAWASQSGTCLTADYPGKAEEMAKKAQAYKDAVMLENGEQVTIEGRDYTVKYTGPHFSDPIHFIPVK